jgi:carboxyl-terminal processing protease
MPVIADNQEDVSVKKGIRKTLLLFVLLLTTVVGYSGVFANIKQSLENHLRKLVRVAQLAELYYVEAVSWDSAVNGAINGMLQQLDPHSVYLTPEKVQENEEKFNAEYIGIGIEYDFLDAVPTILSIVPGSPAEAVGLVTGDQIIEIDHQNVIGKTQEQIKSLLRGERFSNVQLKIHRYSVNQPLSISLKRDRIPYKSVTASFMADDSTGYVHLNRFAATTAIELDNQLRQMETMGMNRLILDLRDNPGGYLHEAVKVAAMFIPGHQLIVYTKGRTEEVEEEFYSDRYGRRLVRDYPLVVLINHNSASAAEIVAGAIQDYDRGIIIGENSFGKGLVQREFPLDDGSAVRITTARYFTPSGRCIQRPYKGLAKDEYYQNSFDSTFIDNSQKPQYYTANGRIVYGGGGIHPDILISESDEQQIPQLHLLIEQKVFKEVALNYWRICQNSIGELQYFVYYQKLDKEWLQQFRNIALRKGIRFSNEQFAYQSQWIENRIKAQIAKMKWGDTGYQHVLMILDKPFTFAKKSFKQAGEILASHTLD